MTDVQSGRDRWIDFMENCIQQTQGDSLEDLMMRASFEHAKSYTAESTTGENWAATMRGEVAAMLRSAEQAGYLIHKAAE